MLAEHVAGAQVGDALTAALLTGLGRVMDAEAPDRVACREHQAHILFIPFPEDAHPDHRATTRIAEDARFDAKLTKIDLPGAPIYPRWVFYYYCTHLRWVANPAFCLDITGFEDAKRRSIEAYHTQFVLPPNNRRVVQWLDSAGMYFGSRIGTAAAEPFHTKEPLGLTSLDSLAF